mgnify:FL=1
MSKNEVFVEKRWLFFWLVEAAAAIIYILLWWKVPRFFWCWTAISAILSVIWFGFYYSVEYSTRGNTIIITSGILFHRERTLPAENILWVMRLELLFIRREAITVLHTSGGNAVIFGRFSTKHG